MSRMANMVKNLESLMTGCITVRYGNCSAHSRKSLQRIVKAQHITGNSLPTIQDISHQQCLRKAHTISKVHSHPARRLFSYSPCYRLVDDTGENCTHYLT